MALPQSLRKLFNQHAKTPAAVGETSNAPLWNKVAASAGRGLDHGLNDDQLDMLRLMFVPGYYGLQAGLASADPDELFVHFLTEGLKKDASPSPLFDRAAVNKVLNPGSSPAPAIVRWLRYGKRDTLVPTPFFDAQYYLDWNPDVAKGGIAPFEHFIRYGSAEERIPNAIFDATWYRSIASSEPTFGSMPLYLHYLAHGMSKGLPPRQILHPIFAEAFESKTDLAAGLGRLLDASRPWIGTYGIHKFVILLGMFLPHAYDGEGRLPSTATALDRLLHFLEEGGAKGFSPGPLFNEHVYRQAAASAGVSIPDGVGPLTHFLRDGIHRRIVPTKLFDETYYLREHADIANAGLFGFEHFVVFGIYEGRKAQGHQSLRLARPAKIGAGDPLRNWRYFWAQSDDRVPQDLIPRRFATLQRRVSEILSAPGLHEAMAQAMELEPALRDIRTIDEILVAPLHDYRDQLRIDMRARVEREQYDNIICIPWLRTGGADLVACLMAEAARDARPNESVLLLRTDQPHFERPDWVPDGIDVADVSDLLGAAAQRDAEFLLFTFLQGLAPKRVINVNSRLCWRVMARFGARMTDQMALYSYLFCWDQDAYGRRAGYPTDFFSATAATLDGLFTDTDYLRDELIRLYNPPAKIQNRMVTLHSPSQKEQISGVAAEAGVASQLRRPHPVVLWAGRLDKQKRFDLVQEIAGKLRGVDFICWGSSLLDAGPDLSKSPPNLTLHKSFASFDDLPLWTSDVWLYTSAWDGMPTTLIELAQRGACVVASSVGGVPELLDETTGWPVHEIGDVDAYVAAIEEAIGRPQERIARARNLQERVQHSYSKSRFRSQLAAVLDKETAR